MIWLILIITTEGLITFIQHKQLESLHLRLCSVEKALELYEEEDNT